ncbi:MAG TPA: hypothetical protein VET23_01065 [Chitinophagaceae bacterium]|nr:hypothetical protein [Chitinophagaceae bacterium]
MKKIYYLSTCTTSQSITGETGIHKKSFVIKDIKFEKLTQVQLNEIKK